jgi:hypothetical protein
MSILADYLTEGELAKELGKKTPRTLEIWRQQRTGPAWTKIGRKVVYRRDAVIEWLKSQEQQPVRQRKRVA